MNCSKFFLLLFLVAFLPVLSSAEKISPDKQALNAIPFKQPTYTYIARNATVREALAAFSSAQDLSIILDPQVAAEWRLSGEFKNAPSAEFLSRICAMGNLVWYYDHSALYLYNANQIATQLVDLQYIHAQDVRKMLNELGVEDPRYPIATTHHDELLMVSGPPRYVELILEIVKRADKLQQVRANREDTVMIFRLQHAWADDITLGSGDRAQSVRGVASLLQSLMDRGGAAVDDEESAEDDTQMVVPEPPKNTGYAKLAPRTTGESKSKDGKKKNANGANNDGRSITADNRTNSVIVRDTRNMMPHYAALIKQLDVPVRLVEIAVTVMDIEESALFDWELRVKGLYRDSNMTYGFGSDAGNVVAPENIGGLGLAGSALYTGDRLTLLTSLTALTKKSQARTISRPSLLTLDNISAFLTDTKSYRSKVVGKEVVELAEVTAGMRLSVQPRIVDLPKPLVEPNEGEPQPPKYEIWMMLNIEDGGFESMVVDGMPMTRSSTLETQAGVREGESLLVGGYMHEDRSMSKWGIPWLRDLPWVGWLFGGYGTNNERYQRMFLLTPRVITLDAVDLPYSQAINLRTTNVERRIESELNDTEREQKSMDDLEKESNEEKQKAWEKREKEEKAARKAARKAEDDLKKRRAKQKAEAEQAVIDAVEKEDKRVVREMQDEVSQQLKDERKFRREAVNAHRVTEKHSEDEKREAELNNERAEKEAKKAQKAAEKASKDNVKAEATESKK